ncbi:AAA family ATPase [Citrobacter portucalensis]|uniref:AAA family ATPase n=1 Tax=Citrobacter portucalensis TaxID=1639133 RepID=UPI00226B2E2F|nr:AAA family ATPase [Citrobacter portucalensis]MCX9006748.1 AAA family ATPase [Citrobacter portucalensis]
MDQNIPKEQESTAQSSIRRVSIRNLFLDPNNYRLIHEDDQVDVPETEIKDKIVQQRTTRLICGDKNQYIQDLIDSFRANGYLPVDQIQVRALEDNGYVVIEGNRRVAALKTLLNEYEQKGNNLGKVLPEFFSSIPVVIYPDSTPEHHLTLMALKHISGNKKWGEWNQAKLLENMSTNYKLSETDICHRIGISKVELRRSLRALSLVAQYRNSDYGDQFTESRFPIFRQTIRSQALKVWLGWNEDTAKAENLKNKELFFSLLSREPIEEEDENGHVGYSERFLEPAISKRDDIDLLAKIVSDERALSQLQSTRDLNSAYRASDLVFKERQEAAIRSVSSDIDTLYQLAIRPEYVPELESAWGKLKTIIDRTNSISLTGVSQTNVYYDRIKHHFEELDIINYRQLVGMQIKGLSLINIFAGLNNTGKTSLLEAIYLLIKQNDLNGLIEVMRRRGKVSAEHLDPTWMIEQLTNPVLISGVFDNHNCSLSLKTIEESDNSIDKTKYLSTIEIDTTFSNYSQTSLNRTYKGRERETIADYIKLVCPVAFSSPFFLNEPHHYAQYYHKSVQSKSLPLLIDFLKASILPTLRDIRLTDERQRFIVDDEKFDEGVDISSYGEGLQRIFFMSLIFSSASNGVVLIDEFENALHHSLISDFSSFIYKLAKNFNVQVFITSHSKECIDAFTLNEEIKSEDLACHALVNNDGKITNKNFDGDTFRTLVEAGNVDLRDAR